MTTAFVLAGGGSLGAVEVGMLIALAEAGVRPDLVVGSSVGAVNGVWTAARPDDPGGLAELWKSLSRKDVFPIWPVRAVLGAVGLRDHVVPNTALRRLLKRNPLCERLEDAVIPVHVGATDLLSGEDVLLSKGDAVEATLASTAVPGVFPPVHVDGRVLVDGSTVNNNPVPHAVALQALTLAVNHRLRLDVVRYRDVVELRVVTSLCPLNISPADFNQAAELIDRAHRQTRKWLETGMSHPREHAHG